MAFSFAPQLAFLAGPLEAISAGRQYQNVRYYFWNIYEWVVSMLQKMPDEGKEFFLRSLNCYINDANTSEAVKIEWRKLHNIE